MVTPHPTFKREDNNIFIKVPISSIDATIGCTIQVPTVYGDVELKIPEGTQPNTKFRLKGKGVKARSGQGDEFVEVQVEIPRKVSRRERELYEELKSDNLNLLLKDLKEHLNRKRAEGFIKLSALSFSSSCQNPRKTL